MDLSGAVVTITPELLADWRKRLSFMDDDLRALAERRETLRNALADATNVARRTALQNGLPREVIEDFLPVPR